MRKYCFRRISGSRCSDRMSRLLSLADCCCGVGRGWGDNAQCMHCPRSGSGKYLLSNRISWFNAMNSEITSNMKGKFK